MDDLEAELQALAREELPTNLPEDNFSASAHLGQIEELRQLMGKISGSTEFTRLATGEAVALKVPSQEVKDCLNKVLGDKVVGKNQSAMAPDALLTDTLELAVIKEDGESDLRVEGVRKYA